MRITRDLRRAAESVTSSADDAREVLPLVALAALAVTVVAVAALLVASLALVVAADA
jgi:hypothetical protein